MGGDERAPNEVRHSEARAKGVAVEVTFNLGHRLWPRLMVLAMTPDDALALSIDLQKAAIEARQCEHRRDVAVAGTDSLPIG
jgi:hypothetical protein